MLTKAQRELMNRPVWRGQHCVGYRREFLSSVVVQLVLEAVHPSNLGALPPSPRVIAWKAVQLGLCDCIDEAFELRACGQFN